MNKSPKLSCLPQCVFDKVFDFFVMTEISTHTSSSNFISFRKHVRMYLCGYL